MEGRLRRLRHQSGAVPEGMVRTAFKGADIWLRRDFDLQEAPTGAVFLHICHCNHAAVYLNGVLAAKLQGPIGHHAAAPISQAAQKSLRSGKNTLAIHCREAFILNKGVDQYIDAGLVEWLPEARKQK